MKNTCVLVFDSPKKINAIFECKCVTSVRPDLIIRSESLPLSRKKKKEFVVVSKAEVARTWCNLRGDLIYLDYFLECNQTAIAF